MKKYLEILDRYTPSEQVYKIYLEACKSYGIKTCLFTYVNIDGMIIYVLPKALKLYELAYKYNRFDKSIDLESIKQSYKDGFVYGYDSFMVEAQNSRDAVYIDYVLNCVNSFTDNINPLWPVFIIENKTVFIDTLYYYGRMIGCYYAAWCLILEHQNIFNQWLYERKEPQKLTKQVTGFQSKLLDKQIENLYNQMQSYIISTPEDFKSIFKNKPLPDGFKKVERLKPFTVVLCAYFIYELFQKENPDDYWSIAESCFDAKNLRQSLYNAFQYNPDEKPKGYKKIDAILNTIYNPLQ